MKKALLSACLIAATGLFGCGQDLSGYEEGGELPTSADEIGAQSSELTTWWKPTPGTSWQIQLSGTLNTSFNVKVYDLDLFDTPTSTIAALKARGIKVVCYFSAGSYEEWRSDASQFPASSLGYELDGWPGERWLDTRNLTVRAIMKKRMDLAKAKGCDAVDPDNVDGYANNNGKGLTATTQLDYNKFLATEAHLRGLAVGLKNDVDQIPALLPYFDFTVNEECFQYNECNLVKPFITANKAVFNIEYGGATKASTVCPKANSLNFDTLVKRLSLGSERITCR
jgi:hypothetical protein